MMLFQQDRRLLDIAEPALGVTFDPGAHAIGLGSEDGRRVRAVSIFERFTEGECHIHLWTDGSGHALSMNFLRCSFWYPFVELKLRRLTGLVPSNNEKALRLDMKLGFKEEGRMREALPDCDIVVLGMLRRECRFIPPLYRR